MSKFVREVAAGVCVLVIVALGIAVSTAYQAALKQAQTPKVALTPTQLFLASLPAWAVIVFLLVLFIAVAWVNIELGRRRGLPSASRASDETLRAAIRERDEARAEASALKVAPPRGLMEEAVQEARVAGIEHQAEEMRRERDQAIGERDETLLELADLRTSIARVTLRQAAFDLAKELREKNDSVSDDLTLSQQCDAIFEDFNTRFWTRYERIKDRMGVVLPPRDVKGPAEC